MLRFSKAMVNLNLRKKYGADIRVLPNHNGNIDILYKCWTKLLNWTFTPNCNAFADDLSFRPIFEEGYEKDVLELIRTIGMSIRGLKR